MADCIFCQVVAGELPSYKIYEDQEFIAILDIFPKSEGHTLVIPKKHVEWVWDYPDLSQYFAVVGKIARHLRQKTGQAVVRGLVFGLDVPHAHVHLMPGKLDQGTPQKLPAAKLQALAQKLKLSSWPLDSFHKTSIQY